MICADDFGINAEVSKAIVDLCRQRRLDATSVLIDLASDLEISELLALSNSVKIGLHLDLFSRPVRLTRVKEEVRRQISHFENRFGFYPQFIDGHMHCHIYPLVRSKLFEALGEFKTPQEFFLRSVNIPDQLLSHSKLRSKAYLYWLKFCNRRFLMMAEQFNIRTNRYTWGIFNLNMSSRQLLELSEPTSEDIIFIHPSCKNFDTLDRVKDWDLCRQGEFQSLLTD